MRLAGNKCLPHARRLRRILPMPDDSLVIMSAMLRALADAVLAQSNDAANLRAQVSDALAADAGGALAGSFVPGYASGSRQNTWRGVDAVCRVIDRLYLNAKPAGPALPIAPLHELGKNNSVDMAELCLAGIDLLEGINQYPVIVHCDDMLLFGAWLGPYRSANAVLTDPVQLRELLIANEIMLVDPARLVGESTTDTVDLARAASEHVELRAPARFDALLDVTALRQTTRNRSTPRNSNTLSDVTLGLSQFDTDDDEADSIDKLQLPSFKPPLSDTAALSSLAVALNMPRATPDHRIVDQIETIPRPASAATRAELFCVLPADADQRSAVKATNGRESFCLIAPPGTGGVQTAVNICSQLVAQRTQVLVVGQSKHHRNSFYRHWVRSGLDAAGDTSFAELSEGIASTQPGALDTAADIEKVRDQLMQAQRDRLNYVKSLGPERPGAWSLHEALGICALSPESYESLTDWRKLDPDALPEPAKLNEWCSKLRQASHHLRPASHGHLEIIGQLRWSQSWEASLIDAARALAASANEQERYSRDLLSHLGIEHLPASQAEFVALRSIADNLSQCKASDIALACHADLAQVHAELNMAMELTQEHDQCKDGLDAQYTSDATSELELDELSELYENLQQAGWPRAGSISRKIKRQLRKFARDKVESVDDVVTLTRMRDIHRELETLHTLAEYFPNDWSETTSDLLTISEKLEAAEQLVGAANTLSAPAGAGNALQWLTDLNAKTVESSDSLKTTKRQCNDYVKHAEGLTRSLKKFVELAAPSQRVAGKQGQPWLTFLSEMADKVVENRWEIKDWCEWRNTTDRSGIDGLPEFLKTIDQEKVGDANLADALRFACARAWLEKYLYTNDPDLLDEANEHPGQPERHRQLSKLHRELIAQQVLDQSDTTCVIASTETVLQNETLNERRFDTVVFLDADRISTRDAIAALGLAKRGIFVGDPYQAAPNLSDSLYQNLYSSVANADVLHQVIALGLPALVLRQDYSATDPMLIDQSNRFAPPVAVRPLAPANDLDRPVQVTSVSGAVWAHSGKRDNTVEAVQVVAEVAAELRTLKELPSHRRPSICIVGMTDAQCTLIREKFNRYRIKNPDIDQLLNDKPKLQISVRSAADSAYLTDIVFLSTTVANLSQRPDKPIIDVLVGRNGMRSLYRTIRSARHRLHIITSLTTDDLDPHKFSSGALGHLHRWIDADNEPPAGLPAVLQMPDALTQTVRETLNAKGWQAAIPMDSMGAGIDLIVEHPELPGHSLAGIVTDAGFFSQPRHDVIRRDDCQERALTAAGWNILQAWPLQWCIDKEKAAAALHNQLITLREQWRIAQAQAVAQPVAETTHKSEYQRLTLTDLPDCDPDRLMASDYGQTLTEIITRVVEQEGPIRKDYLANRIAALHQLSLLSDAAHERIDSLTKNFTTTQDGKHQFLWPNGLAETDLTYRAPVRHEDKRQLAEISPQELKAIAHYFKITSEVTDGPRALARAIGIAFPASSLMRERLVTAIKSNA